VWLPPSNLIPTSTPKIGKQARRQLDTIKAENRGLAKLLTEQIVGLLDEGRTFDALLIPDPPRIGPRFMVDLDKGYVAVYWVVLPIGHQVPVLWVEQVILRSSAEAKFANLAPSEED
jgi:hypothetical protein